MGKFRTIWTTEDKYVEVIDQRKLPHEFVVVKLETYEDAEEAIKDLDGSDLDGRKLVVNEARPREDR